MEIHPPHAPAHSFKDFVIQLLTITAGVLIALSLEGAREWNHYRTLVNEARGNIRQEIADNKKEIEAVLGGSDARKKQVADAIQFANDILAKRKTDVRSLGLAFEVADRLSAAAWQTAEQTGALAHMEYAEVQKYSRLYGFQALYVEQQRRGLEAVTEALGPLTTGGDPANAPSNQMELFRQRVVDLQSLMTLQEQFARKLVEDYTKALQE